MKIDLRSDTVTRPTPSMKEAMINAPVGDDVFGDDPTVNELEKYSADLFGMEAALFCPSGTMTNQIAIKVHTQPGDEVICDRLSHIYNYEGGGIAFNSGASVRLLAGVSGILDANDIRENINDYSNTHFPRTSLVALENTVNKGGGAVYPIERIREVQQLCKKNALALHLDGARLFNALVATGESPSQHGELFDSISICLSKGLGAPVGSLLLGKKDFIFKARRIRKVFGGGMRQAGFIAAAGLYALQHQVQRLKDDHIRAANIAKLLGSLPWIEEVLPTETNIVIFRLADEISPKDFLLQMAEKGILLSGFGKQNIRIVTHLDFDDTMLEVLLAELKNYVPASLSVRN